MMQPGMPPEQAQQGPEGDLGKLVANVGQGLGVIAQLIQKTEGAPPEALEAIQASMSAFEQAISAMSGEGPAAENTTSPEQGANPNAQPASAARR